MGSKQSDGDIDMLDEEDGGKQKGNRNHYALTRQKKKKSWLWSGTVPPVDEKTGHQGTRHVATVYTICIQASAYF